ncbi:MAG: metallophosphoesterase, partial [Gammaproteobacteria bacterium]|nr:metallophosphoesterase [Gammaproteobacteria bacterium]
RDEMKKFYNYLPFIVYSNKFIACHAGPPIRSTSYTELVDIHQHPMLMRQLINVRVQRNGKLDGYSSKDVKKFRNHLKLSSDTPVIAGHTPISNDGTLWEQVGDINEHYIVYGANDNWIGVMADVGEHLYPFIFPVEQLSSVINNLD